MEALGGYSSNTATFDPETVDESITAPMPQNTDGASVTVKNLGDGVATFPAITYTAGNAGRAYVYKLTEVNEGTAGVAYDDSVYYMVVRVNPLRAGITITREYYDAGGNKLDERPAFSNTYDVLPVTADADNNIKGTKTVANRAWNEGETYIFTMMPDAKTEAAIAAGSVTDVTRRVTVSAPEEGSEASFTASPVDADAMTFKKSGTYIFTVAESYTDDTATSGITCDSHKGTVTYTVTDTGEKDEATGKSKLAVSVKYADMDFTNTYKAKGTFSGVSVTNTLNGRALESDKFAFDIQGLSYNGEEPSIDAPSEITIPNGDSGQKTVLTNTDGSTLLSANTDQSMVGKVQAFAIRETSAAADGYTFDTRNTGAALVLVEVKAKADMPADLYAVTRVYKGAAVTALLDSGAELDDAAIESLGDPVQTVDSSQTGDKPSVDFVNKYEATLDYGAQSNLKIHVALAYKEGSAVTDRTHAFEVIVKPVATDTVTAEEAGKHLTTSPTGKLITTSQMTPSAADEAQANAYIFDLANFKFGAFTQADAGKTFAFDTSEVVSTEDVDGYTFDTNTYRTWITVKDNGDGTLTATTVVKKMNADGTEGKQVGTPDTCSTNTKGSASTYVPFTNTYKAYPPADYTPQVTKAVAGKDATESETFSFEMVAADDDTRALMDAGMLIDSTTGKAVAPDAKLTASTSGAIDEGKTQTVNFDKLIFNKVGIYKFNISEIVPNDTNGWKYDQHVYELTVTVRDSGGKLTAEASGSSTSGGSTFSNTFSTATTLGNEGGFDVEKVLNGRTLRAGEFTFKAEGDDDASKAKINLLDGAKDGVVTATNEGLGADGRSTTDMLDGMSFSTVDRGKDFTFTVSEEAGSVAATTYDTNYYKVTITPYKADGSTGELALKVTVVKYDKDGNKLSSTDYDSGKAGTVNPVVVSFENTYKARGSWAGDTDSKLNANVTLTGRDLAAGELHYNVYAQKADQSSRLKVSEAVNKAADDGKAAKIAVPEVKFNLGEGMAEDTIDLLAAVQYGYARKLVKDDGTATYTIIFQMEQDMAQVPAGVRLSNQGDATRTARLIVTDDGKGYLTASVEYRTGDDTGSIDFNNVYEKVKAVTAEGSSKDLDGKILSAGGTYTYRINWVNNAATEADGVRTSVASTVTITDTLPAGVEFVSATDGGTYNDGTVTWTLTDCAANSYGSVGVTVRVKGDASVAAAKIGNQAQISVENGSDYKSNETSNSVLSKTTSADEGAKVKVGDVITYTIGYANDTDDSATVTLTDTLPAGVEFIEASNDGTCNDGIVTWTFDNAASGETGTVTVKVRVLASAVDKTISNSATMRIGDDEREVQTAKATNYVKSGSLKISKTVESASGVDAPDATFTFKVTLMDADGNELHASEQYHATGDFTGYVFNGATFSLKEGQSAVINGLPEGYTYRVDETSSTKGFVAKKATYTGTIEAENTAAAAFVNEYTPDAAVLDGSDFLKVTKNLSGRAWQQNDKFTFTLTRAEGSDDAPMPQGGGDTVALTYNQRSGSFGDIDYNKVGEWSYYVTETKSETDNTANLITSQAKYKVNVSVKDAGEESGKLKIEVSASAVLDDEGNAVDEDHQEVSDYTYAFTNTYVTAQDLTISNTVTAADKLTPSADQKFGYTIELKYQDGTPVNGEFGGLTFVNGKATFELKANDSKKLSGLPANATYTVTQDEVSAYTTKVGDVETREASGSLPSDAETAVNFTNGYAATQTDPVSIYADVEIEGRTFTATDLGYHLFNHQLMAEDGKVVQTKDPSIEAGKTSAKLIFDAISFDKPGVYTYTFKDEDAGEELHGVKHDGSTHKVTITVTDNGVGKLQYTLKYDDTSEGAPTFHNVYKASAATSTVSGSMSVSPSEGNAYTLEADQFGFTLKNTEKPAGCETKYPTTTVKNKAPETKGDLRTTFAFDELTFPVAGTYKFTVTEDTTSTPAGISSSGKVYEVTYKVTDDGNGQLQVERSIVEIGEGGSSTPADTINFAKTYNPESVAYTVSGAKVLKNTDAGTTRKVTDGEFSFTIAAANDAAAQYLPEKTAVSNAGTAFTFGAITYDHVGEYSYTVSEVAGNDATITYDDHACTINVKVVDEDGVLKVSDESSVNPTDGLTFTNSFTPAAVSGEAISGNVTLDGRDADEGEFTVKVTDKDGNTVEVKPGTDGNFSLDAPTFDKTGVYTYTVSQEPGDRGGMTYDNTVYTVTYTVKEDPETHKLVVEREITKTEGTAESEPADSIEFKNKYAPAGKPTADVNAKVEVSGKDLGDGEFTVIVVDKDGNVVAEAKNNADGTVDLSGIELPGPGTYTFTVKEKATDAEGVTIDSREYTVTIVVTDDLNGGYNVEVPTFKNTYTAPSDGDGKGGKGNKKGKKTLPGTGDDMYVLVAGIAALGAAVAAVGAVSRRRNDA